MVQLRSVVSKPIMLAAVLASAVVQGAQADGAPQEFTNESIAALELRAAKGDAEAAFDIASHLIDCVLVRPWRRSIDTSDINADSRDGPLARFEDLLRRCDDEQVSLELVLYWASLAADRGHVEAGNLYAFSGMLGLFGSVYRMDDVTTAEKSEYLKRSALYLEQGRQAGSFESFELSAARIARALDGHPDHAELLANLLVMEAIRPSSVNAYDLFEDASDGLVLSPAERRQAEQRADVLLRECCR